MTPSVQWAVRLGCLVLIAVGTLMHMVGMGAPFWVKERARPSGIQAFLALLKQEGVNPGPNASLPGAAVEAEANVGLWRWCVEVEIVPETRYEACRTPGLDEFPSWWRACQALDVVGTLMGVLACICAGLEVFYTRHGVRFSGLAVLCAISCFVAAVGMGLSHGLFATKYMGQLLSIIHLPQVAGGGVSSTFPPVLNWAFGLGAAGATVIGATGIVLVAFITRTYPVYQRTENVIV